MLTSTTTPLNETTTLLGDDREHQVNIRMLYHLYQPYADVSDLVRLASGSMSSMLGHLPPALRHSLPVRSLRAAYDLVAQTHLTHERPPFGIEEAEVGGVTVAVTERVIDSTPFGSLLHFQKQTDTPQPKALLIAPLSGHFATLLRSTVRTMLADHDVYITDWHNARDAPLEAGAFGMDEYVDHIIRFIEHLGEGTNVVAVCQPCVPALAATALLAQDRSPVQPRTLTLMAGPIDTRINPTSVNDLATSRSIEWFEDNVISTVPARFPGARRRVYPGFLQIAAFMSMNTDRHVRTHVELYGHMVRGDDARAQATRDFYDEYFAVLDIPAEFYLETVNRVFQTWDLARGVFEHRGRRVDPSAIRRTALLTVEGERDDICSVGQTMAAHELCSRVTPSRRLHHLQAGVGHYGVFSGSRWEKDTYPLLRHFVLANN